MPDMNDNELDCLLSTLNTPEPSSDLTARIMTALPEHKPGWARQLADIFGVEHLAIPAGGAFACLLFGLMLGYWPLAPMPIDTIDADTYIADVFGDDQWDEAIEELTQ